MQPATSPSPKVSGKIEFQNHICVDIFKDERESVCVCAYRQKFCKANQEILIGFWGRGWGRRGTNGGWGKGHFVLPGAPLVSVIDEFSLGVVRHLVAAWNSSEAPSLLSPPAQACSHWRGGGTVCTWWGDGHEGKVWEWRVHEDGKYLILQIPYLACVWGPCLAFFAGFRRRAPTLDTGLQGCAEQCRTAGSGQMRRWCRAGG